MERVKEEMDSDKTMIPVHPVLGGYWKCEDCGLLIEDELFVCPECKGKKTENEDVDKRLFVEPSKLTMKEHEEMLADSGYM